MESNKDVFVSREPGNNKVITLPPIMKYFVYDHLPDHLQAVSKQFAELAHEMAMKSAGPETSAGLRKLLEAKDCFVRASFHEKL
jgi:hypothetical protein